MSAVIDTLVRCKVSDAANLTTVYAIDPNGVHRTLEIGSLVYATDIIHIDITNGASIAFQGKISGEWDANTGFGIVFNHGDGDTCKRWMAIAITGTETDSQVSLSSTPDSSVQRTT